MPMFILLTVAHFQMENLKKAASEDDKKRQEDKKQADVYESHSKFMKSKVSWNLLDIWKGDQNL